MFKTAERFGVNTYVFLLAISFVTFSGFAGAQANKKPKASTEIQNPALQVSLPELRSLQAKIQAHKFLSLNFQQSIYKKLRNKTIRNQGAAYFKKPSMFHWKFHHPEKEEWIYDGTKLFHYFPDKKVAQEYSAMASKGKNLREIVSMVLDFDSLLNRYSLDSSRKEQGRVVLSLKPKQEGEITGVQLTIDNRAYYVREVKLFFEGGNNSTVQFSDPKYSELKDSFRIPEGVKISKPI